MTTKDPLDVMEGQLREVESAVQRLATIPEGEVDAPLVFAEMRDTFLPLLSEFMVLSFQQHATTTEYLQTEVEPLVIADAERNEDPSELAPEDADLFSDLISGYQKILQATLDQSPPEDADARAEIEKTIGRCAEALERIEEIALVDDDEETEDADGDGDEPEVVSIADKAQAREEADGQEAGADAAEAPADGP